MVDITKSSEDFLLTLWYVHITVAAKVYCKEQDTEKCLVCVKKLVQTLVYTWDMQLYVQYIPMYMECNNVNLEIFVYENIYVLMVV